MEDNDHDVEQSTKAFVPATPAKRKGDEVRESSKVFENGLKLRAGGIPWRYRPLSQGETQAVIEVLLVESINKPGVWTFPGGTLETGEDVAQCAARETEEECGVQGTLGCFVGVFEQAGKQGGHGSRSYIFCLNVHTVLDDGNDRWQDPGTSFEGDGFRRRRWYVPTDARPLIKTPEVLDAFLEISSISRLDPMRRPPKAPFPRILLLSASNETEQHCSAKGRIVYRQGSNPSHGKEFAVFSAALWEADLVIAADVSNFEQVGYALGLAAAQHCSVLCVHTADARIPPLLNGDPRIRCSVMNDLDSACSAIDSFLTELGFSSLMNCTAPLQGYPAQKVLP